MTHVENLLDIFVLGAQNDDNMQNYHRKTDKNALEVNPEDLTTVPSVDYVVETGRNDRNVHKSDLKERISVDSLVIFHALRESCLVNLFRKELRILNPEQLETGDHRPRNDSLRRSLILLPIFGIERIVAIH